VPREGVYDESYLQRFLPKPSIIEPETGSEVERRDLPQVERERSVSFFAEAAYFSHKLLWDYNFSRDFGPGHSFHRTASKFMESGQRKPFSEAVTAFQGRPLPEAAIPVGYAALIDAFELAVPVPIHLAAIGPRHRVYEAEGWRLYTPRHRPEASLGGHLTFRTSL
jgi:hypothetical protein